MIEVDGILYTKISKQEFKKRLIKDLDITEKKKKAGRKPEPIPEEAKHYYQYKKAEVPEEPTKLSTIRLTPKGLSKIKKVYK